MESLGLVLALFVLASVVTDAAKEVIEHPYIVSIHKDAARRNYICAGSLVATTWVLTTSNCLIKSAFKVRHGDMMAFQNATYSRILQKIHHRSSRSNYNAKQDKRLIPKSNNIGLALIEEARNRQIAVLSGVDYSAMLGLQVTYFEFDFQPVFKAKIYEHNKIRIHGSTNTPKIKRVLEDNGDNNVTGVNLAPRYITVSNKVLRIGEGIAIKCHYADHPGPNICVGSKCIDLESVSDPRDVHIIPDYGAPLVHDKKVVGITSEVEKHYTRYTPVSPYLEWIGEHIMQRGTRGR